LIPRDLLPVAGPLGRFDPRRAGVGDVEFGQADADGGPEPSPPARGVEIERDRNAGIYLEVGVVAERGQPLGGLRLAGGAVDRLVRPQGRGHPDVFRTQEVETVEELAHPAKFVEQSPGSLAAFLRTRFRKLFGLSGVPLRDGNIKASGRLSWSASSQKSSSIACDCGTQIHASLAAVLVSTRPVSADTDSFIYAEVVSGNAIVASKCE